MQEKEVIALIPRDDRPDATQTLRALVRFPDGRMAVEDPCAETLQGAAPSVRFRRSAPIIDPATREIIGYELERILLRGGAGA